MGLLLGAVTVTALRIERSEILRDRILRGDLAVGFLLELKYLVLNYGLLVGYCLPDALVHIEALMGRLPLCQSQANSP